jgi:hypothetical protein
VVWKIALVANKTDYRVPSHFDSGDLLVGRGKYKEYEILPPLIDGSNELGFFFAVLVVLPQHHDSQIKDLS